MSAGRLQGQVEVGQVAAGQERPRAVPASPGLSGTLEQLGTEGLTSQPEC